MRIRTGPRRRALVLLPLLALAGCGGGTGEDVSAPEQPRLAAAAAERLASRADTIAARLAAGDVCSAAQEADALAADTDAAVDAGEVPAPYRDDLVARAEELVNAVNCPPPVPQMTDEAEDDDEPGRGKKKGKKKRDRDRDDGGDGDGDGDD